MTKNKIRPIRTTISLDEALTIIAEAGTPIDRVEIEELHNAGGRILACNITAEYDVPPFDRAAMDGYAVIAEDTFGASRETPCALHCIEKVMTGQILNYSLTHGNCVAIATGAPMPAGADAVVMFEDTDSGEPDQVRVFEPVRPNKHVGNKGADITEGQVVLNRGDLLNPSRIGALAAVGICKVSVFERPRVAILSTGNEVIDPGKPLGTGQIYDINKFTLGTIIREHGGIPISYPTVPDTLSELSSAVDDCLDNDILVFSGGSSVGERDLTLDVLHKKGEVLFHGIAVKPGKPTIFGRIEKTPVFGMPGYPTSCLSNAYILLIPLLRSIAHLPTHNAKSISVPAAQRFVSTTGRHQFYTVRIVSGTAVPAFKASGDITSMSQADGYIEIPAQTNFIEKGEMVDVIFF